MGRDSLRKSLPLFLVLVLLSTLFYFADHQGWLESPRGLVEQPITTLQKPFYLFGQSSSQVVGQLGSLKGRDQELLDLEGRLRQLALDQNQLAVCQEENQALQRLLGAPLPPQWRFLLARVVGQSEKMRLDQGKEAGVEEGMVVVSENILAGKVISVGKNTSLVQLPSDPNSKIPVVIKRPGSQGIQAQGLLLGQFGEKLVLDRVLQEEDIQKGDLVTTSGEEGWLPNLVIGQIDEVLPPTAAIYQKARVDSLIDYSLLRIVFVVMP